MSPPDPYSPQVAAEICKRLAAGESLRSICRDPVMPGRTSVHEWVINDRDGFASQYTQARAVGLDEMAEELFEISDDGSNDWMQSNHPDNPGYYANGEHQARSRLRVDTRKWYLSKLAPKRYGDKLELSGPDGQPINAGADDKLVTLVTALLERSRTRITGDGGERQSLLGSDSGPAA